MVAPRELFSRRLPREPALLAWADASKLLETNGEPSDEQKRLIANAQAALGQRPAKAAATADFDEEVRHALARLLGLEEPPPNVKLIAGAGL